ncbi:MAG: transposase [Bryobacteraceae bacterium]
MSYHERHLPHWQPEGTALFITWRLNLSLPASTEVLKSEPSGRKFVAVDRELDKASTGPRWLKDERVAQAVVDTLLYGQNQLRLYRLRAWVLMINHVHILIYPVAPLPRITKAIKNFSARRANAILGHSGQPFWQDESYDHWVRSAEEMEKIVRYIEGNPVAAGLVSRPEDWRWSSACAPGQAGRPVLQI